MPQFFLRVVFAVDEVFVTCPGPQWTRFMRDHLLQWTFATSRRELNICERSRLLSNVGLGINPDTSFLTSVSICTSSPILRALTITFFSLRLSLLSRCQWSVRLCCLHVYRTWEVNFGMKPKAGYGCSCTPVGELLAHAIFCGMRTSIIGYGIFLPCCAR